MSSELEDLRIQRKQRKENRKKIFPLLYNYIGIGWNFLVKHKWKFLFLILLVIIIKPVLCGTLIGKWISSFYGSIIQNINF